MNKILCTIFIAASYCSADCYPSHSDPTALPEMSFQPAIENIKQYIKNINDQALRDYQTMYENQITNILNGFKTKKRLLTNMQNLGKDDDITKSNDLHEIELKKELDGLLIDSWGTE